MVGAGRASQVPVGIVTSYSGVGVRAFEKDLRRIATATEQTAKNTQKQTQNMTQNFTKFTDSTEKAAKNFEVKTGRAFIRSISAIYATTRLMPQIAAEFGEALQSAAAGAATRQAFLNLSADAKVTADSLISNMQRASRGTINEIQLMQKANRAFLVGGRQFALELPRLLEISRASAIATGQDVEFVFDSLTKGIARASVKLIDNAEIYLKIGNVVEDYAAAQGKTADELSVTERQQVILNEVLEQGADIVEKMGGNLEFASDSLNRTQAEVDDLKQAAQEFILEWKLIDGILPGIVIGFQEFNNWGAQIVQTFALLAIAGVSFRGILAGIGAGITGLLSLPVLAALTGIIAGVTAGTLLWDNVLRRIFPSLHSMGEELNWVARGIEFVAIKLTQGQKAADQYAFKMTGALERAQEAQQESTETLEEHLSSLQRGRSAYLEYVALVQDLNSELLGGEQAIRLMTQAQWEYNLAVERGLGSLELQIKRQEEYIKALLQTRSTVDYNKALEITYQLNLNRTAKAQLEAAEAAEKRAEAEEKLADVFKDMTKLYDKRRRIEERFLDDLVKNRRDMEEAERDYAKEVEDIIEDSYEKRKDADDDYAKSVRDAERDRARSIEEARRRHTFRMEDIERDYRRRLIEIEEDYDRSVFQAALDRDALALFRAKQRRADETKDAERDRDDATREEIRDYQETLRQIEQQYQDRLEQAKERLAEEERDLQESLKKRQGDEAEDHAERMAKLAQRLADVKQEYTHKMNVINAVIKSKRNEIQRWLNAHPVIIPVRQQPYRKKKGRPGTADEGFSGVVQGPTSISVGSGVTEYIYASGDLNRQPMMPSPGAVQSQQMRHAIAGGVNVGLLGFSDSLMGQIGPALKDTIGQAIMDQLADEILRL